MTLTGIDGNLVYLRKSHVVHVGSGFNEIPNPEYVPAMEGESAVPKTIRQPCLVICLKQSQPMAVADTEENRSELQDGIDRMDQDDFVMVPRG